MKVGFIGIGNMGAGMSINLAEAGHDVMCFDSDDKAFDLLGNKKITKALNLKEIALFNDIIITMLPNGKIVKDVWSEVLKNVDKKTILVDCSTIDVKTSKDIQKRANKNKIFTLDAPVSGGVIGSNAGTLTFMVGGSKVAYEKMIPLFEIMGNKSVFCGDIGTGQTAKICNNMLLAITMIGAGEAFKLGKNLGLDLNKLFEVISTSSASCWAVNTYCPIPNVGPKSPSDNSYVPGFSGNLMLKDLTLALQAIEETGTAAHFGIKSQQAFQKMIDNQNGKLDFSAIINENFDF